MGIELEVRKEECREKGHRMAENLKYILLNGSADSFTVGDVCGNCGVVVARQANEGEKRNIAKYYVGIRKLQTGVRAKVVYGTVNIGEGL